MAKADFHVLRHPSGEIVIAADRAGHADCELVGYCAELPADDETWSAERKRFEPSADARQRRAQQRRANGADLVADVDALRDLVASLSSSNADLVRRVEALEKSLLRISTRGN